MTMQRFLAPLPAEYDLPQLVEQTTTRWPDALGVNLVDADLAVYLDADPGDLAAWRAAVAAHVPAPVVAVDPSDAALAAVQTARNEVAGYAATNGTRQAVEALATAVETLVKGDTP